MKKLFISQPMDGRTIEQIAKERSKAIEIVEENIGEDVEIINNLLDYISYTEKSLWYLGRSLELLYNADVVYFAKGWQEDSRCRIENFCAREWVFNDNGKE